MIWSSPLRSTGALRRLSLSLVVMLSDLLQGLGESLLEAVFYVIGRIVIPVASFGRWRCLPLLSRVSKEETSWGGLIHRTATRIYFTSGGTAAVGGLTCLLSAALVLTLWYLRRH